MLKKDLRIVFMGTPDFAKASLQALVENNFNVVGVFCKEDKPKGRGMNLQAPPVKEYAVQNSIPVYQPTRIKQNEEVMNILHELAPDLIVVVAYGKILPKEILEMPKYGAINVHGSLLPKYRGAAPIQWSVINGDNVTGVTTMYMDEGMDTGNMITKSEAIIEPTDTYGTLHDKLMVIGAKTLVEDLERLLLNDGTLESKKQGEEYTVAPMLSKEISKIDFNKKPEEIVNLVRGTNPFPTAWCKLDDERIYKIYEAEKVAIDIPNIQEKEIGEIVYLSDKQNMFVIKCTEGLVNLKKIKPAGSKLMQAGDYLRGAKVTLGEKFI